jgi:DNA ligase-associated metallophosphoesterase
MKFASITMTDEILVSFGGSHFLLSSEGVLFHQETGQMIVSDCHFGKTTHFRKNALPVPEKAIMSDFQSLKATTDRLKPERICFLGDLFHSTMNREWEMLSEFLYTHIKCKLTLVLGNHDILTSRAYENAGFELTDSYMIDHICCIHDRQTSINSQDFTISGHLHPGYRIKGLGRQQIALPCFYMSSNQLILPAFGSLTGLHLLEKNEKTDRVFCFTPGKIFEVL